MQRRTFQTYLQDRNLSTSTVKTMLRTLKYYKTWLKENNISAYRVKHTDVIAYIDHMKQKKKYLPHTINLQLLHIKYYYIFLGNIKNPFESVKIRGEIKRVNLGLLSEEDLQEMYNSLPEETTIEKRAKVLAGFYIFQGVSTSDMLAMKVKHVELLKGKIVIPQTRLANERILPIHPLQMLLLVQTFMVIKQEDEAKIYQCLGVANQDKWVCKHLNRTLKSNKQYQSLRHLRHSVIVNWLKNQNLRQVQYNAGHRYISTTQKFSYNDITELRISVQERHPLNF